MIWKQTPKTALTSKLWKNHELNNGLQCAGFGVQALATGQGALGSLAQFSNTFGADVEEIVEGVEKAL